MKCATFAKTSGDLGKGAHVAPPVPFGRNLNLNFNLVRKPPRRSAAPGVSRAAA